MVTLMVLQENCVRVCVRASARAWAKECLRFNMKEEGAATIGSKGGWQ